MKTTDQSGTVKSSLRWAIDETLYLVPRLRRPASKLARIVLSVAEAQEGAGKETLPYGLMRVEYTFEPKTGWGYDRPQHRQIAAIMERHRQEFRDQLEALGDLKGYLRTIPMDKVGGESGIADDNELYWNNGFFSGLDAAVLYATVASANSGIYLEIGSGYSTRFARRAVRDHRLRTRIISIDPQPRAEVKGVCDEIIRSDVQEVGSREAQRLKPGDILFLDGSHYVFQNSDTTWVLLELLPSLPPGVLVHVHDIFWPRDYPPDWSHRFYNEQYLIAPYLLGDGNSCELVMSNAFAALDPELSDIARRVSEIHRGLDPLKYASSIWLRTL